MAVSDYSTTPDENVTISGINIAEGCAPSGINNAIRQLMADVKTEKNTNAATYATKTEDAAKLPLSGGTMTGTIVRNGRLAVAGVTDGDISICNGTSASDGAGIWLIGKDAAKNPGRILLQTSDGTNFKAFYIEQDGSICFNGGLIVHNGDLARSGVTNGNVAIYNGTSASGGGGIWLYGKDHANAGKVRLQASNGTDYYALDVKSDGTAVFTGPTPATSDSSTKIATTKFVQNNLSNYLPKTGGTISGNWSGVFTQNASTPYMHLNDTTVTRGTNLSTNQYSYVRFNDTSGNELGCTGHQLGTDGVSHTYLSATQNLASSPATCRVTVSISTDGGKSFWPYTKNDTGCGSSGHPWSAVYAASSSITTSDERLKQDIDVIPDDVLDAWGEVGWAQFRFCDAVAKKGDAARLHSGLIAQRIDAVFKSHGLDATRYGLLCYDAWEAEEPSYDEDGNLMSDGVEAGDKWSVRYEEALAMEAAYQRRRADRIEARLTALERKLDDGSSSAEEVANADYSD